MKTCEVTLQNGVSWTTSINGSNESIENYFRGKLFYHEAYSEASNGPEKFSKCINVKITD